MRWFRVLLFIVLITIGLGSGRGALSQTVKIEPERAPWEIFTVDEDAKICGMSRRFQRERILFFSGTVEMLSHISIMDEQAVFDPKSRYSIAYRIGTKQKGDFEARASGGGMLVAQKPRNQDMKADLLSEGKITIRINGGDPMIFDLEEIETAIREYDQCLGIERETIKAKMIDDIVLPDGRVAPPPEVAVMPDETPVKRIGGLPVPPRKPSFRPQPRQRYTEQIAEQMKQSDFAVKRSKPTANQPKSVPPSEVKPAVLLPSKKPKPQFLGPKTDVLIKKSQ